MKRIEITKLPGLLQALREKYRVYGPVKNAAGDVALAEVTTGTEVTLDFVNSTLSAKGLFFPQCETLFRLTAQGMTELPQPEGPFVAFAVRPCDADAIKQLDHVFSNDPSGYVDPYYHEKRRNGVVIALACNTPCATCFCASMGGGPHSTKGADILLTRVNDHLLCNACTDKGRDMLNAFATHFQDALADEQQTAEKLAAAATASMKPVDVQGVPEKLATGFTLDMWNTMFTPCLGCGVCTYVCPTCHCFDILDETGAAETGVRLRAWDSCQFALFTLHASGHNPRPSKKERMRQRVMHKFSYTVENYKEIFCVGCGRCVRHCPVNLDIREMLATIRAWKEAEEF